MPEYNDNNESDFPETRIPTAMILAQRIIDMFEAAEATDRERRVALNIAKTLVLDASLYSNEPSGLP